MVRSYDGTHIGKRRFNAIFRVAASAVEAKPENEVTGKIDKIWYLEREHKGGDGKLFKGRGRGYTRGTHGQGQRGIQAPRGSYADIAKSPPQSTRTVFTTR